MESVALHLWAIVPTHLEGGGSARYRRTEKARAGRFSRGRGGSGNQGYDSEGIGTRCAHASLACATRGGVGPTGVGDDLAHRPGGHRAVGRNRRPDQRRRSGPPGGHAVAGLPHRHPDDRGAIDRRPRPRHVGLAEIDRELARARRFERPFAVARISFGPGVSSAGVGETIEQIARRFDRYFFDGREEVLLLMPETPVDLAQRVTERVAAGVLSRGADQVAVGVAGFPGPSTSATELLDAAAPVRHVTGQA